MQAIFLDVSPQLSSTQVVETLSFSAHSLSFSKKSEFIQKNRWFSKNHWVSLNIYKKNLSLGKKFPAEAIKFRLSF